MMAAQLPLIPLLMGPTAAGKSSIAIRLARELEVGIEIVSVDSALVYRGMTIGTAKPDASELSAVPHHLIDLIDPAESYSVARFRRDALEAIEAIVARGHMPLLVGGTMLYFRALLEGLSPLPSGDAVLREQLDRKERSEGSGSLHAELTRLDPALAATIHPNDPQRIKRALEIITLSGRPASELRASQADEPFPYRPLPLVLAPPERRLLDPVIEQRFMAMLDAGLVDEVAALHRRGDLHPGLSSMRCVGYRQVWAYLDGEYDRDCMVERALIATRQLAKRQYTWLRGRHFSHAKWIDPRSPDALALVRAALQGS